MKYAFGNAQHIGRREGQQDAFGFSNPSDTEFCTHAGFVAVLADGMGGLEHGELASRAAVKAFLDTYQTKAAEESVPEALTRALNAAQDAVRQVVADDGGTTLVAAVLREAELYWISVGDSALFLRRAGELTQLNRAHIYAAELDAQVLAGALTREAAQSDPQRESLTSYLGAQRLEQVDRSLRPMTLAVGDGLLLASDGLFKSIAPGNFPARAGDAQEYCEQLVAAALAVDDPDQDNITVLMLEAAQEAFRIEVLPPVTVKRAGRGIQVAVAGALLVAGVCAAWWVMLSEQKPVVVAAPGRQKGSERFDTSQLPEIHEAANPEPETAAPPPIDEPEVSPPASGGGKR